MEQNMHSLVTPTAHWGLRAFAVNHRGRSGLGWVSSGRVCVCVCMWEGAGISLHGCMSVSHSGRRFQKRTTCPVCVTTGNPLQDIPASHNHSADTSMHTCNSTRTQYRGSCDSDAKMQIFDGFVRTTKYVQVWGPIIERELLKNLNTLCIFCLLNILFK